MAGIVRQHVWTFTNCNQCDCVFRVYPSEIRNGNGRFCSKLCYADYTKARPHKSYTRLYQIWCHMKSRCYCSSNVNFDYYGGRGIAVCHEWRESFETFEAWAKGNGYRDDLEIDRRESDGNYEPGNCRWANRVQQMRNCSKRTNAKTSRYKGVSWCANAYRWRVQLHRAGRPINGGFFLDETEAARQYDRLAVRLYGEFAKLNFAAGSPELEMEASCRYRRLLF
jgi:hypothetical protein